MVKWDSEPEDRKNIDVYHYLNSIDASATLNQGAIEGVKLLSKQMFYNQQAFQLKNRSFLIELISALYWICYNKGNPQPPRAKESASPHTSNFYLESAFGKLMKDKLLENRHSEGNSDLMADSKEDIVSADIINSFQLIFGFLNWNLQWVCFWQIFRKNRSEKLDFLDSQIPEIDYESLKNTFANVNELVVNSNTKDLKQLKKHINHSYEMMRQHLLTLMKLSFPAGTDIEDYLHHTMDLPTNVFEASVTRFVYPLNNHIISSLEKKILDTDNLMMQKSCLSLNLDIMTYRLIICNQIWLTQAKFHLVRTIEGAKNKQPSTHSLRFIKDLKTKGDRDAGAMRSLFTSFKSDNWLQVNYLTIGSMCSDVLSIFSKGIEYLEDDVLEYLVSQFTLCFSILQERFSRLELRSALLRVMGDLGVRCWKRIQGSFEESQGVKESGFAGVQALGKLYANQSIISRLSWTG